MPQYQIASSSAPPAAVEPALGGVLGGVHSDPIAPVIFGVTGILFFAVLGRFSPPTGSDNHRCSESWSWAWCRVTWRPG